MKRLWWSKYLLISIIVLATACSGQSGSADKGASGGANDSAAGQSQTKTDAVSADNTAKDPFGKYSPPIEVTTVRQIDASYKFAEGESLDKNIWTPIFENELGIKVKNLWVVDSSQYRQKLNVAIASGDLPDIMEVNKVEMQRLIDADMIQDLTQAYNDYAYDFAKKTMNEDGGAALASATIDGKLMGIPKTNSNGGVSSAEMIWVRTDWLNKLNLPEPKTMDDVIKIAEAFARQDPDGNGKDDTFGLAINKDIYDGSYGSLLGFFNGYHAYPNIWVKGEDGKLVYGSTLPEMKVALQKLQDMFKAGLLDREFAVKAWKKVEEDTYANKIGLAYGRVAVATGNLKDIRKNDKNAQWQAYPIVSADSKPARPQAPDPADSYYVVRKGFKYPEAAFKLLNVYLKKFLDTPYEKGSDNPFAIDTNTGIFPAKYAPVALEAVTHNLNAHYQVVDALNKGTDPSTLGFPASLHLERNLKYRAGDDSMWFSDRTFGPEGSYSVIAQYYKDKNYIFSEFMGAPTPTMVEKQATLDKMQLEVITKIIMNAAPVSEYDKFIEEWKKLGGDKITEEVNAWYAKNKKG